MKRLTRDDDCIHTGRPIVYDDNVTIQSQVPLLSSALCSEHGGIDRSEWPNPWLLCRRRFITVFTRHLITLGDETRVFRVVRFP